MVMATGSQKQGNSTPVVFFIQLFTLKIMKMIYAVCASAFLWMRNISKLKLSIAV